jgi:hypothetical protein
MHWRPFPDTKNHNRTFASSASAFKYKKNQEKSLPRFG